MHIPLRRHQRRACLTAAARAVPILLAASCASPSFVPDNREKLPPASARAGSAEDVFMRAPWERWRVPNGTGRYHRGTHLLLRDEYEAFRVTDVSVYAADGSDVRIDYGSVDLGSGSQARVTISVFVYRAPGNLEDEWRQATNRMKRRWPGGSLAEPFPAPAHHPDELLTAALLVPGSGPTSGTFVQTYLFRRGEWAARYELACATEDIPSARAKMLSFLGGLPAGR